MTNRRRVAWGMGGFAAAVGFAAAAYAAYVGASWYLYGSSPPAAPEEADELLDRFMPVYDVAERHHIRVDAPAEMTFAASMNLNLEDSHVIRAIFRAREVILGAGRGSRRANGLVATTKELGWTVLAEVPGREIVMGAVTQPWRANVVFRGLPPEEFARFNEPDYVKIAWTLRADALSAGRSMARTETRVVTTDEDARRKFRWYWARFSAGIVLIREISLRLVKKDAERRAVAPQRANGSSTDTIVPPASAASM